MNQTLELTDRPAHDGLGDRPATGRGAVAVLTVYLVDPHELVQLGVQALLAPVADLRLVGVGSSADDAHRAVVEGWADLVLIDAHVDGDGGRRLCRQLSSIETRARACFLVDGTRPADAAELTRLGARCLLHRRTTGRHLVDALRRCATEPLVMDPLMTEALMAGLLQPAAPAAPGLLTDRDLELLRLLGEGRTNREIADAVYLSEKTVKNYLSRLFRKLGVRSRTEAALLSARYGAAPAGADVTDRLDVAAPYDVTTR